MDSEDAVQIAALDLGSHETSELEDELQLMRKGVWMQLWKGWAEDKQNRQQHQHHKKKPILAWKIKEKKIRGSKFWLHPFPREKMAKQFNFEFFSRVF